MQLPKAPVSLVRYFALHNRATRGTVSLEKRGAQPTYTGILDYQRHARLL